MNEERILAIRYIIYKVAQDFLIINNKNLDNVEYFNENNNFSLEKCLLLPFIVTIANGKKEELITTVFENAFLPDIRKINGVLIGEINSDIFHVYNQDILNLNFIENKLKLNFDANEFTSLDSKIRKNIDYSIQFLKEKRIKDFSNLNVYKLIEISNFNDACDRVSVVYKNKSDIDNVNLVSKFQEYILRFPFYLSLVEQEKDIDFAAY